MIKEEKSVKFSDKKNCAGNFVVDGTISEEVAASDAAVLQGSHVSTVYDGIKRKPVYDFFKRFFDILVSSLGIIVLSPLLLTIAILVKCTSKGPALYVSQRVGKDGKIFKFYKFRTMVVDADKQLAELLKYNEVDGGVIFKMEKDPRVTKVGKFLRKSSLDELPQLFNVFIGNMTFVGPRPCTVREYELYNAYHRQRLTVKQGITCLWQCSGRSKLSFENQIELDLEYISKRGAFYDIWILLRTIPAVFGQGGAE